MAAKGVMREMTETYKTLLREKKAVIGTNLFNRFNRGFLKSHNQEENENIVHSEFLFKQLKFQIDTSLTLKIIIFVIDFIFILSNI